MPHPKHLELIPLGGLGEFGMNLMVYRWGAECLIVDAGMMFPGEEHLGVDVVLPDLSFLDDCGTIHGLVLTHGHEDHVGAVPFLLARHDVPTYATRFTLGLVRRRIVERNGCCDHELRVLDDAPLTLGPFTIEAIPVPHSIPQSRMLVVHTPLGVVLHTADFKLEGDCGDGRPLDLERLRRLGREGVLALLTDSTNADRPGRTAGEPSVASAIDELVSRAEGRVLVNTFASQIQRVAALGPIARRHGRRIALVGGSLKAYAAVAEQLGIFSLGAGTWLPSEELANLPPARVLAVVAGSQGEPMSSMARVAVGQHRELELAPGDLVIHSARRIPGNEKSVARMINHLLRRGAEVVTADDAPVHVSGHASRDELRELLDLVRPRFVMPIHGEYRQLSVHARLAVEAGVAADHVQLADSGDVVAVSAERIEIVDRVHVGQVFIDDMLDEVDVNVLRDRRRIVDDGIVVAVVAVHRETGAVNGYPEIVARGFAPLSDGTDSELPAAARDALADSLADATAEERADEAMLRARIQSSLKRFLRRRTQRRPLVIPVILEL